MKKGLNLIELSLILLALGVLIAVALPRFMDLSDQAKSNIARDALEDVRAVVAIRYAQNAASGIFPIVPKTIEASMFEDGKILLEPLSNSNRVEVGTGEPSAVSFGWYYDRIRGRVFINNKNFAAF